MRAFFYCGFFPEGAFAGNGLAIALVDESASMAVESYSPFFAFKKLASFCQIAPAIPLTSFGFVLFTDFSFRRLA